MQDYKFNRVVKETFGQVKKHYTQFTDDEMKLLRRYISQIDVSKVKISKHAKEHLEELDYKMIKKVFSAYSIIEFNLTSRDDKICPRVLIRSKDKFDVISNKKLIKGNLCLVYDIYNKTIVSAYINESKDCHNSIDMARYVGEGISIDICKWVIS